MAHATADPCSNRSEDTPQTLSAITQTSQTAARREAEIDAYITRVVSEAPKRSDEFLDRIAVLLRPRATRNNGTAWLSEQRYQSLEYRRFVDNETPGKFGFFTADSEAAA